MNSFQVEQFSVITCPNCGVLSKEEMPEDFCLIFYECNNCGQILRPNPGDCCVFCSFGTVKCPSKQVENYAGN